MCAMLALIVPDELKIGPKRALRFIESYIGQSNSVVMSQLELNHTVEMLMRLRLHVAAAYLRKYTDAQEVQNQTAVSQIGEDWFKIFSSFMPGSNNHLYYMYSVPQAPTPPSAHLPP